MLKSLLLKSSSRRGKEINKRIEHGAEIEDMGLVSVLGMGYTNKERWMRDNLPI